MSPLPYGDFLYLYENGNPGVGRYTELFRRTLPGFGAVTTADVRAMRPMLPALLEVAILKASGYIEGSDPRPGPGADAGTGSRTQADEGAETIELQATGTDPGADDAPTVEADSAPEEGSIWAQHNQTTAQAARETADIEVADLMYALHEHGESYEALYALTMAEIETLMDGAARAKERADEEMDDSYDQGATGAGQGAPSPAAGGGRRDRAADLGFR